MRKVEYYRQQAAECRAMLSRCTSDEQRQMVMRMAETWDSLADRRTDQLAHRKRMLELEAAMYAHSSGCETNEEDSRRGGAVHALDKLR